MCLRLNGNHIQILRSLLCRNIAKIYLSTLCSIVQASKQKFVQTIFIPANIFKKYDEMYKATCNQVQFKFANDSCQIKPAYTWVYKE